MGPAERRDPPRQRFAAPSDEGGSHRGGGDKILHGGRVGLGGRGPDASRQEAEAN